MVHGYMSNSGYEDVRESIAASLNRRFGTEFAKENLVMTVGAAGGLNVALKTILEPGDEVLLFAPYFGEYNNYISNFDGVPVVVEPDPIRFSMNLRAAEPKITAKTKAVIIILPIILRVWCIRRRRSKPWRICWRRSQWSMATRSI